MSAYVIVEVEVTDPAGFERYRQMAPKSITQYGGRYIARGGETKILEGDWVPKRIVILEFENLEQATRWHQSEEYHDARNLRNKTTHSNMIVVSGIE